MSKQQQHHDGGAVAQAIPMTRAQQFFETIEDPMNSVIAASVITMSSLGIVLGGAWFISTLMG